jgi:hypothetical protein
MSAGPEDFAALREDGDLERYLRSLVSSVQPQPEPPPAEPEVPAELEYVIPHRGAWPIGTAPGGPTPMDGRCSCPKCNQAA